MRHNGAVDIQTRLQMIPNTGFAAILTSSPFASVARMQHVDEALTASCVRSARGMTNDDDLKETECGVAANSATDFVFVWLHQKNLAFTLTSCQYEQPTIDNREKGRFHCVFAISVVNPLFPEAPSPWKW